MHQDLWLVTVVAIMLDLEILKLLSSRDSWHRYGSMVKPEHMAPESRQILRGVNQYYERNDVEALDWGAFSQWFKLVCLPSAQSTSRYDGILDKLATPAMEEGGLSAQALQAALRDRYYGTLISDHSLRVADGNGSLDEVRKLLDERDREAGVSNPLPVVDSDISDLVNTVHGPGGLEWRMRELQLSCGPVRRGDLICFAARVHAGKTTWLASEATHMAAQLPEDKCVLWFNNEEAGARVKLRCIQAALGVTQASIRQDPQGAKRLYTDLVGGWSKIVIIDSATIGTKMIERAIREHPPGLIVFDQLRKVRGFGREERNDVQRIAMLYQYAKALAKQHAPVISVHQASDAAINQLYPSEEMLYGCRTEIQGELEAQIMMGKVGDSMSRGINIVKNRLPSPGDESLRLACWEVTMKPEIARFV
jgi:replicative DNA helicase